MRAGHPGSAFMAIFLLAGPAFGVPLNGCDKLPKPTVTLKALDDAVAFNLQLGYRDLTSRAGEKARPGWQVLGLTQANAVAEFALDMPVISNGQYECASPQITVTLGIRPLTVFVGREFPKGSCAYKEILDHEMRHVKAYQEHMAKVRKTFEAALTQRYATDNVWRGAAGSINALLTRQFNDYWSPAIVRDFERVEGPQRLIDTPEEYARIAASCGGEVKKLMK